MPKTKAKSQKTTSEQSSKRKKIPDGERLKLMVRAGGRCSLCKEYLLEGKHTWYEISGAAEAAHIVGQQESAGSPRGQHSLPRSERDKAENLLLTCGRCHPEIDDKMVSGLLDVEKLRQLKGEHEDQIKYLTSLTSDRRTVVLRMVGQLRGKEVELNRDTASACVIQSGKRFPDYSLSYQRHGVEIDLRRVAGECAAGPDYYNAAKAIIDEVFSHKLNEAMLKDHVNHLSVFAWARIPLLVYLGSKLDDNVPTDVYQRHRATELWNWEDEGEVEEFSWTCVRPGAQGPTEIVVIANISGTIKLEELPPELAELEVHLLKPVKSMPHPDIMRRQESLLNFLAALRQLFSSLEQNAKSVRKIHFLGALPISAAITVGRAQDPHVHPKLAIYERADNSYKPVLEVP